MKEKEAVSPSILLALHLVPRATTVPRWRCRNAPRDKKRVLLVWARDLAWKGGRARKMIHGTLCPTLAGRRTTEKRKRDLFPAFMPLSFPLFLPGSFLSQGKHKSKLRSQVEKQKFSHIRSRGRKSGKKRNSIASRANEEREKSVNGIPFRRPKQRPRSRKGPFFVLALLLFRWGVFHALLSPFSLAIRRERREPKKEERRRTMISQKAMP